MFWWFFAAGVFITGGLLGMTIFRVWFIETSLRLLDRGLVPKEPPSWAPWATIWLMLGSPLYWVVMDCVLLTQHSETEPTVGKVIASMPFLLISGILMLLNMSIYNRRTSPPYGLDD